MRSLLNEKKVYHFILFFSFFLSHSTQINAQSVCDLNHSENMSHKTNSDLSTESFCSQLRYIRVNIHFMLKSDGTGNFREYDDGLGNTNNTGYWYAQDLISGANYNLANNAKMMYPIGNTVDNPLTNIRYVLSGVYFHRDDDFYSYTSSNRWTNLCNNTYGVDNHSEMNVFLMNSDILNSQGGLADFGGIAASHNPSIGNYWTKLIDVWRQYKMGNTSWLFHGLFNHEIGHLLGLYHPFQTDPCEDTPNNATEWCNGQNNMMDYNCWQNAITPCQLQTMQNRLDGVSEPYRICCTVPPATAMFSMRSHACIGENILLKGAWRTIKQEESYSIEIYQTDAVGSNNNLGNYWTQNFSGQYGDINLSSLYSFNAGNTYRVKLTVNSSACVNTDTETKWISINNETAYLQNQTISNTSTLFSNCHYFIGENVDNLQTTGHVILTNSGNLSVKSGQSITLSAGTFFQNGANGYFEVNKYSTSYSNTAYKKANTIAGNSTTAAYKGIENESNVSSFPNPNNGKFKITLNYPEEKNITLSINNSLGEEIYKQNLGSIKNHTLDINIENQPNGFYYVNVKNNKEVNNFKIILSK